MSNLVEMMKAGAVLYFCPPSEFYLVTDGVELHVPEVCGRRAIEDGLVELVGIEVMGAMRLALKKERA